MTLQGRLVFAALWALFVTTPGSNAIDCVSSAIELGFVRTLPTVAAILRRAAPFPTLSGSSDTALIAASPARRSSRARVRACRSGSACAAGSRRAGPSRCARSPAGCS